MLCTVLSLKQDPVSTWSSTELRTKAWRSAGGEGEREEREGEREEHRHGSTRTCCSLWGLLQGKTLILGAELVIGEKKGKTVNPHMRIVVDTARGVRTGESNCRGSRMCVWERDGDRGGGNP